MMNLPLNIGITRDITDTRVEHPNAWKFEKKWKKLNDYFVFTLDQPFYSYSYDFNSKVVKIKEEYLEDLFIESYRKNINSFESTWDFYKKFKDLSRDNLNKPSNSDIYATISETLSSFFCLNDNSYSFELFWNTRISLLFNLEIDSPYIKNKKTEKLFLNENNQVHLIDEIDLNKKWEKGINLFIKTKKKENKKYSKTIQRLFFNLVIDEYDKLYAFDFTTLNKKIIDPWFYVNFIEFILMSWKHNAFSNFDLRFNARKKIKSLRKHYLDNLSLLKKEYLRIAELWLSSNLFKENIRSENKQESKEYLVWDLDF